MKTVNQPFVSLAPCGPLSIDPCLCTGSHGGPLWRKVGRTIRTQDGWSLLLAWQLGVCHSTSLSRGKEFVMFRIRGLASNAKGPA